MNRRHPPPRINESGAGTAIPSAAPDTATAERIEQQQRRHYNTRLSRQPSRRRLTDCEYELGTALAEDFDYFATLVAVAAAHVRGPRFSEINRLARLRGACMSEDDWLRDVEKQERQDAREAALELRARALARRVESTNVVRFPRGAA